MEGCGRHGRADGGVDGRCSGQIRVWWAIRGGWRVGGWQVRGVVGDLRWMEGRWWVDEGCGG